MYGTPGSCKAVKSPSPCEKWEQTRVNTARKFVTESVDRVFACIFLPFPHACAHTHFTPCDQFMNPYNCAKRLGMSVQLRRFPNCKKLEHMITTCTWQRTYKHSSFPRWWGGDIWTFRLDMHVANSSTEFQIVSNQVSNSLRCWCTYTRQVQMANT